MKNDNNVKHSSKLAQIFSEYGYDVLTATISLLDLITDICVLIQFWNDEQYGFFYTSLAILCFAQFSYSFVFTALYSEESKFLTNIAMILLFMPLGPLMGFIMYFTSDRDTKLSKLIHKICCFRINFDSNVPINPNAPKLRQWMQKKIIKHIGFIIEACIESFPERYKIYSPCLFICKKYALCHRVHTQQINFFKITHIALTYAT